MTGMSDEDTMVILRFVQRRLGGLGVVSGTFGTRDQAPNLTGTVRAPKSRRYRTVVTALFGAVLGHLGGAGSGNRRYLDQPATRRLALG